MTVPVPFEGVAVGALIVKTPFCPAPVVVPVNVSPVSPLVELWGANVFEPMDPVVLALAVPVKTRLCPPAEALLVTPTVNAAEPPVMMALVPVTVPVMELRMASCWRPSELVLPPLTPYTKAYPVGTELVLPKEPLKAPVLLLVRKV